MYSLLWMLYKKKRTYSSSSSKKKISSTVCSNTFAISIANFNDGLYFPFSKFPIVSLRTPTNFANSACCIFLSLRSSCNFVLSIGISITRPFFNPEQGSCKQLNHSKNKWIQLTNINLKVSYKC